MGAWGEDRAFGWKPMERASTEPARVAKEAVQDRAPSCFAAGRPVPERSGAVPAVVCQREEKALAPIKPRRTGGQHPKGGIQQQGPLRGVRLALRQKELDPVGLPPLAP